MLAIVGALIDSFKQSVLILNALYHTQHIVYQWVIVIINVAKQRCFNFVAGVIISTDEDIRQN